MNKLFFVLFILPFTTAANAQTVEGYVAPSVSSIYKATDGLVVSLEFPVTLGYNHHPELEIDIIPHKADGSTFPPEGELNFSVDFVDGVNDWSNDYSGLDIEAMATVVIRNAVENIWANHTITIYVSVDKPDDVASIVLRLSPAGNENVPVNERSDACKTFCGGRKKACVDSCKVAVGPTNPLCVSSCVITEVLCMPICKTIGREVGHIDWSDGPLSDQAYGMIRFERCTVASSTTVIGSTLTPIIGWVEVDGPTDCDGMTAPSDVGCSSGNASAISSWGGVAGCSGAFVIGGIASLPSVCGHASGPDMAPVGISPSGDLCSTEDLCAPGWHVCDSFEDVQAREPSGCGGLVYDFGTPRLFFATAQSTCGFGVCCDTGTNDIVGCESEPFVGPVPGVVDSLINCNPLNAYSGEDCRFLPDSWDCGDADYDPSVPDSYLITDNQTEALSVQKWTSQGGGVLCCRD